MSIVLTASSPQLFFLCLLKNESAAAGRWNDCFQEFTCAITMSVSEKFYRVSVTWFCVWIWCCCTSSFCLSCWSLCVSLRHGRCFWFFRAVRRRPLQGRDVGGRRGQHARLWGSLESGHARSPPHFLWWTDGPYSAWLQKKIAAWGDTRRRQRQQSGTRLDQLVISATWKLHSRCNHSHRDINASMHIHAHKHTCICLYTHTRSTMPNGAITQKGNITKTDLFVDLKKSFLITGFHELYVQAILKRLNNSLTNHLLTFYVCKLCSFKYIFAQSIL